MSRQMKHYNFPIRNFDGTFTCRFIHLTLSFLLSKCTLLGPSFSRLITRSSHCCNISLSNPHFWSDLCFSSQIFQNIGSKMMAPCACMTLIDGDQQTQLNGCVSAVSIPYPTLLRPILEIWCTMDPAAKLLMTLQSLTNPLGVLSSMPAVGHPMIRPPDYEFAADVP